MSFNLRILDVEESGYVCDKCKKPASAKRPIVDMWTSGRSYDKRNFIAVHEDCLLKFIAKEKQAILDNKQEPQP